MKNSTTIKITANINGNTRHLIPRKIWYKSGRRYMYYRGLVAQLAKIYSRDRFEKAYEVVAFFPAI